MKTKFIHQPLQDKVFDIIVNGYLVLLTLVVIYPLYFILISSVSDPDLVNAGKIIWLPQGITLEGYKYVFGNHDLLRSYGNSIVYTFGYTFLSLIITLTAGYALSRRKLFGRNVIMFLFVFSMYFGGGLIPIYLVTKQLGLIDNPLVMVIMYSLNVFNMIIARTFFESTIPEELVEAAKIDGCSDIQFFIRIALPVSQAIVAVMCIYFAVFQWNSYFAGLIYLKSNEWYPLQLVLREILVQAQQSANSLQDINSIGDRDKIAALVRFGIIIVSSVPMLILYPFLQKYFVQGVMIGSIKG